MRLPILSSGLARTAVAMALALGPRPVRAQITRVQTRERPEVRRLTVTGASHADARDIERNIATQATACASFLFKPFCLLSHSPTFQNRFYLEETEFKRDVLRIRLFYWLRGYREATVDTTVDKIGPRQVHVTFAVHEGPPTIIRTLTIEADSNLINARTRGRLALLHEKDPLDLVRLDSMRIALQRAAWNNGYGDAKVDTSIVVDDSAKTADVKLVLTPNRITTIGTITITGTQHVNEAVVRHALTFKQGDLYRQNTLLESQRNLYESNLFRLAQIQVPPQRDTAKNVRIDVTEAPLHEVRAGPGINNVDFVQLTGQYTQYNMLGGARRLDVSVTAGNLFASSLQGRGVFRNVKGDIPLGVDATPYLQPTFNASIDLKQSSFLRRASNSAGIGVFTHRSINPGVFIDRGYGAQATFTNDVAVRAPVSINYRYELNRVAASDVYFCVNYGVCDSLTIGTLRSHQSLSPLTLTGYVDRTVRPFAPTGGYVARLEVEHASQFTASDYRYNRVFVDGAAYSGHRGDKHIISAHIRAGWVRALESGEVAGVLHPRKRFYAGGASSVRGYGENELGPRILTIDGATLLNGAASTGGGTCALTVDAVKFCDPNSSKLTRVNFIPQPLGGGTLLEASVEYRFPMPGGDVMRDFTGAVFVDGATVGRGDIRGIQPIGNSVKGTGAITPGFGIRYQSPVGPIRMDLGINPNRAEDLPVVTAVRDGTGQMRIVGLGKTRNFSQASRFLDRLVFHLSIGEAY